MISVLTSSVQAVQAERADGYCRGEANFFAMANEVGAAMVTGVGAA